MLRSNKFNKSKLIIKNQWASHPEIEERIAALEKLNITKPNPNNNPASILLKASEECQQKLTDKLFSQVIYKTEVKNYAFSDFKSDFEKLYDQETFNHQFNGYYDFHSPTDFDIKNPQSITTTCSPAHRKAVAYLHLVKLLKG